MIPTRRHLVPLCLALLVGPAHGEPIPGHDHATTSDSARYGCRYGVEIPEEARLDSIEPYRRGGATVFAPSIATIVAQMSSAAYAQIVGELSGEYVATVGGQNVTFTTRHSLSSQAALSWQYAYEMLQAAGWDVAYDDYTRNGNQLKNVVATKTGTVTPERIYVLGGHIDSTSPQSSTLAPGAEDNGSGSAGVLLAAAALASSEFASTIELVLFSGEEQGLWGSSAYVTEAIQQGRDVRAAVTFDMISYYDDQYGVLIEGESSWIALMEVMSDAVTEYTDLNQQFSFFSFGSDHVPFQDAGIPAILAIDLDWDSYPYYHRTSDTFDKTIPEFGVQIAGAGTATIAHLAGLIDTVDAPESAPPVAFTLFPNPMAGRLTIVLEERPKGGVQIYSLDGRLVRRLAVPGDGLSSLTWDLTDERGSRVPAGVYYVRAGSRSERVVTLR